MFSRLLLMTDAQPDWAELFLTRVKESGFAVACLAGSAARLTACRPDVADWYASLAVVPVPATGDCVVWLGAAPVSLNVPVVSAGLLAHPCAGLREVARGEEVSGSHLLLHTAEGVTVLDSRGISTPQRWCLNRSLLRDHAEVMLCDWFTRLLGNSARAVQPVAEAVVPVGPLASAWDAVLYAAWRYPRIVVDKFVSVGARAFKIPRNVWGLFFVEGPGSTPRLRPLPKPVGIVRADPFVARFGDKDWLFFEEYDVRVASPKGVLKCAVLHADGTMGESLPFMERPYHLSYPQIIHDRGGVFVVPESHAARRLDVLPCGMDEHGRPVVAEEPAHVLLEGHSVADATFWQDPVSGERWLFASLSRTRRIDHAVELHLFRLGGKSGWELEAHPMNPIGRDCRYSRCAGPVFRDQQGRLIRPSQAHKGNVYGADVHLMEIVALDATSYSERRIGGYSPSLLKGLNGLHHVCTLDDGRVLVDARRAWEFKA